MHRIVVAGGLWAATVSAVVAAERPAHPAVEAFFTSDDAFVQETVLPNIERHRKAAATITVVDDAGRPLAGAGVQGRLVRHRFLFGACPPEREADLTPRFIEKWFSLANFNAAQAALKWSGSGGGLTSAASTGCWTSAMSTASRSNTTFSRAGTGRESWLETLLPGERIKGRRPAASAASRCP